jgi:hypothetical protein
MTYKTPEKPTLDEWMDKNNVALRISIPTHGESLFCADLEGVLTRLGNAVGVGPSPLSAVSSLVDTLDGNDVTVQETRTKFRAQAESGASQIHHDLTELAPSNHPHMDGVMAMADADINTTFIKKGATWGVEVDAKLEGQPDKTLQQYAAKPLDALKAVNVDMSEQTVKGRQGQTVELPDLVVAPIAR